MSGGRSKVVNGFACGATGGGKRMLPLHDQVVAALTALRKRQLQKSTVAGAAYRSGLAELDWYQGGEYVITDQAGTPVHPEWYSDEFGRLLRRAGLRRITLHDSRHTTLTLMERRGVASDATFREKREDTRSALQLPRRSQRAGRVRQRCGGDLRCHRPVASTERTLQPLLLHRVTRMMRQMQRKAQRRGGMPLPPARQGQVFGRVG
jgi:integrase